MNLDTPLYVLSLDGGGVRGVISTEILKHIERELKIRCSEKFDVFVGTSVGGLIAASFKYLQCSAAQLNQLLTVKDMKKMMHKSVCDKMFGIVQTQPKYNGIVKQALLERNFGNQSFYRPGDTSTCMIPVYCVSKGQTTIFNSQTQGTAQVSEVLDATSASPGYFPSVQIGQNWYIDGGVVANNPAVLAFAKAVEFTKTTKRPIYLLSIGTGKMPVPRSGKESKSFGIIQWFGNGLIDILQQDENIAPIEIKAMMRPNKDRFLRINPPLGRVSQRMDNTSDRNYQRMLRLGAETFSQFQSQLAAFFS